MQGNEEWSVMGIVSRILEVKYLGPAQFLDVFEEETNKMKENAIALIITRAIILLKQLFSPGSVNIVE